MRAYLFTQPGDNTSALQSWIYSNPEVIPELRLFEANSAGDYIEYKDHYLVEEYPTLLLCGAGGTGGKGDAVPAYPGCNEVFRFTGPDANAQAVYDTLFAAAGERPPSGTGNKNPDLAIDTGSGSGSGTGGRGSNVQRPRNGIGGGGQTILWIIMGVAALVLIFLILRK